MYIMKRKNSSNLFDDMTDMFQETFNNRSKQMKTDIMEHVDSYVFTIDMPGIDKNDISVQLDNGYLNIKYEVEKKEESCEGFIRKERSCTSGSRSFYVGNIKEKAIKAKLDNGVLSLFVPKELEEQPKKKTINIE